MARGKPQPVDPAKMVARVEAELGIGQRRGFVVTVRIHVPTLDHVTAAERVAHHLRHKAFDVWAIQGVFDCRKGFDRPVPTVLSGIQSNRTDAK